MGVSYFLFLSCVGLAITAQAQDCSRPTGGPHMVLKGDDILLQTFPNGTEVTFECETGYSTAGGSGVITCAAGTWSTVTLICERKNCGPGEDVPNGSIEYPEGTEFGDKIVIKCKTGYNLVGRSENICGDNGWIYRFPTCEAITCRPPPPVEHGTFSPNVESYTYDAVVRYKCDSGYTRNGSTTASCSDHGQFKPSPPTCVIVDCKDPDIPNADWLQGSRPPHGYLSTVTYRCKFGYEMEGEATQICQIDSQWTPGLPTCTSTVPPTPPPPKPWWIIFLGVLGGLAAFICIGCCCYHGFIKKNSKRGSGICGAGGSTVTGLKMTG